MDIIKKYWWCFLLALIVVPISLNFILLIPAFKPVVGDNANWLSFLGTLIGALASFAMIFFTAKTLEQNENQLNELKRQWEEEHSPYLSCQLIASDNHFKLRILNSASVVADRVSISISNNLEDHNILRFDKLADFLSHQTFVIPPKESIYFDIWISAYKEIDNLPKGYINVNIRSSTKDFGDFKLYPTNFAYTSYSLDNTEKEIIESISKVSRAITEKRFLFK